ncbi:MAG: hypothetical protein KG003_14520 [Bacteroidetes bacterium]|nr:hypothetical protein [Bacteroidota bacterium]
MYGFLFEKGSCWKYRSSDGTIDSVKIYATSESEVISGKPENPVSMVAYLMKMRNKVRSEDYCQMVNFTDCWKNWPNALIYIGFKTRDSISTYNNYRYLGFYDSFRVGDRIFNKVMKCRNYENYYADSGKYVQIYVADSIGIVKSEWYYQNGLYETRDLVDYHVRYHKMTQ